MLGHALARIPNTTIRPTTITRMDPMCFGTSAGFTMPSRNPEGRKNE
jgi:hypothetical protein